MREASHPAGQHTRDGFIQRMLDDLNNTLEQSFFAEQIAHQRGLLQILDPRLKIISLILLLFAVSFSHSLVLIAGLYLGALVLALLSKVPIGFFVKRVWVFIPFFTGVIALPAIFITPGPVMVQLPLGIAITQTGAQTALFLLLRVGTSVSLGVLLILSTPWNNVLNTLGVLHIPDVLVLTLGMTYRYIHLLLHMTHDMFLSRKSRILRRMDAANERHLLAATSGVLLGKSLQMSGEVYLAMESRGYRNVPRTFNRFRMGWIDWISGAVVIMVTAAVIWFSR